MRVSPTRRRRWNNILILSIIAFIAVLNLPSVIKTYLLEDDPVESSVSSYPTLLNPDHSIIAISSSRWSATFSDERWTIDQPIKIKLTELISRWQVIEGTKLDDSTYDALSPQLVAPETIEVWYQDIEEPQRITAYALDEFWLFNNWQNEWIAVSIEPDYLAL